MIQRTLIVSFLTLILFSLTTKPVLALSLQDFASTPTQKEQREQNRQEFLNICQRLYQDKVGSGLSLAPSLIRGSINRVLPAFPSSILGFLDPVISRLSAISNLLSKIKDTLQTLGDLLHL